MDRLAAAGLALLLALAAGCASGPRMRTVDRVDIPRFMGDWYVIAAIPAAQEVRAWNGVESYRLRPGTTEVVETTYSFREGSFDGPLVTLRPVGYVRAGSGAEWGMKFWWWQGPLRLEYLVVHLDEGYTQTIIGRSARDYVWIMARTPTLSDADRERLVGIARDLGYDVSRLRTVSPHWGEGLDLSPSDRRPGPGS
jgi:apolipoprotein D and lipocalin family protein